MADLSKTIQIVFETVDNAGTGIKAIGESLDNFGSNVQNATQPLADITKGILAFDAAVVGLAVVLGSKAIEETAKFEESLYLVQKQLGDTGPSLEKAKSDIEAVALAYGTNANTVAESTASFLAAGYDYETAAQLVDSSTQLMIAGELDAATATKAISASLAGFKVPAEEAAEASIKIGDTLNKIGDISSGAFEEIVDGFQRIAPTAKDAGMSMEEAAGAIATIVDSGRSGEVAATALKSGLLSLLDPSKEATATLKALGVATTDQNGALRSAGDIMASLAGKWDTLTESQKLQTAAIVFGKDQAGTLNALLGDWGKNQDYVAQMTDKTTGAVGSMAREVEGKMGTLQTAINQANEAWRQALETFGRQINADQSVNSFYQALENLGVVIKKVLESGSLAPLVDTYKGAYEQLTEITNEIAKNLPDALAKIDWSKFKESIAGLGNSFDNLFENIDLSTPEGLADIIQTLVDVGANFINTTSGIVEGLKPLFDVIGLVIKAFSELDPEIAKAVGYFLGLSTTVNTVAGVISSFGGIISGAGGIITSLGKLNPALQAVVVAFAAFELGAQISQWTGLDKAVQDTLDTWVEAAARIDVADDAMSRSKDTLAELGKQLGDTEFTMSDFNQAVEDGKLKFNDITGEWELAGDAAGKLGTAIGDGAQYFDDWGAGANLAGEATTELSTRLNDATKTAAYWNDALDAVKQQYEAGYLSQEQYAAAVKAIDDAAKGAGVNLVTMADQQDKAAKSAKQLADESEKFALEWEKLASAERTALFEARADIQVAQIEADAERTVAAMDMLAQSFADTGDVLTELIGLWAELEGTNQDQVTEWIEREYQIREDLAQAQIDLVEAEIARMEAQTRLLERGGTEITIQSDGLEPELEAFMFKVIDRIRVAVAGSYEEFLLGCGAGA